MRRAAPLLLLATAIGGYLNAYLYRASPGWRDLVDSIDMSGKLHLYFLLASILLGLARTNLSLLLYSSYIVWEVAEVPAGDTGYGSLLLSLYLLPALLLTLVVSARRRATGSSPTRTSSGKRSLRTASEETKEQRPQSF